MQNLRNGWFHTQKYQAVSGFENQTWMFYGLSIFKPFSNIDIDDVQVRLTMACGFQKQQIGVARCCWPASPGAELESLLAMLPARLPVCPWL